MFGDIVDEFMFDRWLGDKSGIMSLSNDGDSIIEEDRWFFVSFWRLFECGFRNCIG